MGSLDAAAFETPLLRVGRLVQWSLFEPVLHSVLPGSAKGPGGRPRFDPLLMFKVLVLQRLHGLADDATSFQISDRNSFRAFLGLTPVTACPTARPSATSGRASLRPSSSMSLFETFLEHLQKEHGLALAKKGVMVDASFCEVPRQRNSREHNAQIKAGEVPAELQANPKLKAHKDTDARWTKKDYDSYYGYKDHVKVDVTDKLILKAVVTPANVHDSQAVPKLVEQGDVVVLCRQRLQTAPIKAAAGRPGALKPRSMSEAPEVPLLSREQKASNRQKSKLAFACGACVCPDARQHEGPLPKMHRHGAQRGLPEAHQPACTTCCALSRSSVLQIKSPAESERQHQNDDAVASSEAIQH